MGPWYDFREFGCHLGNVGLEFPPAPLFADLKQQAAAPGDLEGIEEQPGADR